MASLDIGIDFGTCTVIATDSTQSVVVREPSVVEIGRASCRERV